MRLVTFAPKELCEKVGPPPGKQGTVSSVVHILCQMQDLHTIITLTSLITACHRKSYEQHLP